MTPKSDKIPISGKGKRYTLTFREKGVLRGKIDLNELVKLRKEGYSQDELAKHFGVTQKAISLALQRAKEKELYDEELEKLDIEYSIDSHKRTVNKYRCLKCHNYLVPLRDEKGQPEVFTSKGKIITYNREPLADLLLQADFTHLCIVCMIAYKKEPRDYSRLAKKECPKCGERLTYIPVYGDLEKLVPYCENCDLAFIKEPEDEEEKHTVVKKDGTVRTV